MAGGFESIKAQAASGVMDFWCYEGVVVSQEGVSGGPSDEDACVLPVKVGGLPAPLPVWFLEEDFGLSFWCGTGSASFHGSHCSLRMKT